ncbi:MAG: glutamine-hydrolyzing carbamoyl-phosphate synthase small subunit [Alphaproteobacteria bacterium]|nr:glutamine-hydrolyzing carbamoyl-phosphate synthase small subunit [Alphaproteobacteria bacterium]
MKNLSNIKAPANATGVIVMADGRVIWGRGIGASGKNVGEICFNTGMTGYQETLTDPSYAGQIITFTFPHIGNVGANEKDLECPNPAARGLIVRDDITSPSNWRAQTPFNDWLVEKNLPGICGVDTRALTRIIRDGGALNGVICHSPDGVFDLDALYEEACLWPGLDGMDLAKEVTCEKVYAWEGACWSPNNEQRTTSNEYHVVAMDFGAKRNILRCLTSAGCKVTVVPAHTNADEILAYKPDGVFLSNGPGDPAATGAYAVPTIRALLEKNVPIFGICLGHQLLALALGGKTKKMHLGHRGANHPVKDLQTGKVEITSQNHGFCVLPESLPQNTDITHVSLFDGSNEGLRVTDKPAFSVQYHPEASPGPQDSHYLFDRFVEMMR